MVSVGIVNFNVRFYKKETRRAYLYCIGITIISFLLITIKVVIRTFNNQQIYTVYYSIDNALAGLYYLCLNLCRLLLPSVPVISFVFLLHSLRKRFIALNEFLRFILILSCMKISILFLIFSIDESFSFRGCFFVDGKKRTKIIRASDSINAIKFVGRQLTQLIKIMDEINFCYSFQV